MLTQVSAPSVKTCVISVLYFQNYHKVAMVQNVPPPVPALWRTAVAGRRVRAGCGHQPAPAVLRGTGGDANTSATF